MFASCIDEHIVIVTTSVKGGGLRLYILHTRYTWRWVTETVFPIWRNCPDKAHYINTVIACPIIPRVPAEPDQLLLTDMKLQVLQGPYLLTNGKKCKGVQVFTQH